MVAPLLKDLFVPGSALFFLLAVTIGTLLLYGRPTAGRRLLTLLVLFYWALGTPATAVPLVRALSPDYPPVGTPADAGGATAIVVLGGGIDIYRSRGAALQAPSREQALRALEAARIYHLLDRPWVIVTGSLRPEPPTDAAIMARSLAELGVPAERVVEEAASRNTHGHTVHVPPLLAERGIRRFVLVTSRQHMARALRAFRAAGMDPVPSSPEFLVGPEGAERLLPARSAFEASASMMYDLLALAYYRARGWA